MMTPAQTKPTGSRTRHARISTASSTNRPDIGVANIIANWFFDPPNIFDPNSRKTPKPEIVIVSGYVLLMVGGLCGVQLLVNSMDYGNSNGNNRLVRPPLFRETDVLLFAVGCGGLLILIYIATTRWHFSMRQIQEIAAYGLLTLGFSYLLMWHLLTKRRRAGRNWPPLRISRRRDRTGTRRRGLGAGVPSFLDTMRSANRGFGRIAFASCRESFSARPDPERPRCCGTSSRKIWCAESGRRTDRHKIPMVIFDGKGDLEFFHSLLPHIHRAGRLQDLRLLNPARPDISVLYNPFHSDDDNYMAQVNMVFGSFNLHDEFFAKHQLNYLADIVRVLTYTGLRYNFYDVIVMALDEKVLREQTEKARHRIEHDPSISTQRRLNFEMSVKNLFQSLEDRERVPKIQGLLNECMTFLDDELSVITGPYEDLLSIDDVIEQELILFVTLNVNKNTEPVRALGKMLLQNLQLVVGKRYESEEQRRRIEAAAVQCCAR